MPEYKVTIQRTLVQETDITVTAHRYSDAVNMAMDQAGDINFNDCRSGYPEYETICVEKIAGDDQFSCELCGEVKNDSDKVETSGGLICRACSNCL